MNIFNCTIFCEKSQSNSLLFSVKKIRTEAKFAPYLQGIYSISNDTQEDVSLLSVQFFIPVNLVFEEFESTTFKDFFIELSQMVGFRVDYFISKLVAV
ncbi:MAG: hypothetical protein ACRCVT_06940 [Leadbetterella sp.]